MTTTADILQDLYSRLKDTKAAHEDYALSAITENNKAYVRGAYMVNDVIMEYVEATAAREGIPLY